MQGSKRPFLAKKVKNMWKMCKYTRANLDK